MSAANGKSKDNKLPDQAATAALYMTGGSKQHASNYPLDADNKLSSASAAMSLKRADPRDLPSYPVTGLANKDSSAGAAASIAAANKKSFEHWKPGAIPPANKAALLAKDYKAAPLWQPEESAAGSKAALIAHRSGAHVEAWHPDATSDGNSAAGIAMRSKLKSPAAYAGVNAESHSKALKAATGALSTRRRSGSLPAARSYEYPDSTNSAKNALNAATKAARPSKPAQPPPNDLPGLSDEDATRIHNAAITNLSKEMYTSHPPVKPEVEERNRQAGLKAAAMSMAKTMYDAQQKVLGNSAGQDSESHQAARSSHNRQPSVEPDRREQAMQYINLQAAAQKLAAERLAKLDDANADYRSYYGTNSPTRSRMSLRGRRRSSSDGGLSDTDKVRSEKIRSEMSLFNSKLAEVDAKKRQQDRDALMAAAQRNVAKNMQGLDDKVFQETGRASPAMQAEWETKARERAEAESKVRMQNYGKVHIGGGKYLDQSDVDAIAAKRVQPTLDDITEKAEEQRALEEKRRQEAEEERRLAEEKAAEERERNKQTKQVWSQFKAQEKEKKKAQKEEEAANKIYEATAVQQDRRAEAHEHRETTVEMSKIEQEREAKSKQEWQRYQDEEKQAKRAQKEDEKAKKAEQKRAREAELKALKEQEKTRKEEEKARKAQEKRKSRGASFATIAAVTGIGEREKEKEDKKEKETDDKKEAKGKSPERIDTQPHITEDKSSVPIDHWVDEEAPEPNVQLQPLEGKAAEPKTSDEAIVTSEPEDAPAEEPKKPLMEAPKAGILQAATIGIAKPAAQQTSSTGYKEEHTSPREQGRVSSWLKSKFGRRGSRSANASESGPSSSKLTKSPAPVSREKPKSPATTTIEPITNLPIDPAKATPGFGTDNIPHIVAASESAAHDHDHNHPTSSSATAAKFEPDTAHDREHSQTAGPTTGLPIAPSKSNLDFDTDSVPHDRDPANPSEAVGAGSGRSAATPEHPQTRTMTLDSEREIALAGRGALASHPVPGTTSVRVAGEGVAAEHHHRRSNSESRDSEAGAESSEISSLSDSDEDLDTFVSPDAEREMEMETEMPTHTAAGAGGPQAVGSGAPMGSTTDAVGVPGALEPGRENGTENENERGGGEGAPVDGSASDLAPQDAAPGKREAEADADADADADEGPAGGKQAEEKAQREGDAGEEFEEARDAFDTEEVLAPRPRFVEEERALMGRGNPRGRGTGSPVRESVFREEL